MARRVGLMVCLAVAIGASACSRPPDPPPGSETIAIRTSDGVELRGIEVGSGPDVAILSHGATGTKEDFYGLARAFARDGWRAIAYDARGVGASTGSRDGDRTLDLRAVASYALRTGASHIALVGGSVGAALSLAMASDLGAEAVVSLSAPATSYGAVDAARDLRGTPVLVIAARDNEPFADDARAIAVAAGVPPLIVSGAGHGTGVVDDHPWLASRIVRFADASIGVSSPST